MQLTLTKSFPLNMDISKIFPDDNISYLNGFQLFTACYNSIPNRIKEKDIDCRKAQHWFISNYKSEIRDFLYDKHYFKSSGKVEYDEFFYFIHEDLMVYFYTSINQVCFFFKKTALSKVERVVNELTRFRKRKERRKPKISLLVLTQSGFETRTLPVAKPKLSIADNYNDDLLEIHKTIYKRLSKKNDKGIVLLHGKPGTGKTSYIRYLISSLKKEAVFLPPNMAGAITNPSLISILIENPNSVFVIEDAENIVIDRERNGNSPVSALLNISDGLLADCLNIQIICSFNTDLSKVDNALMRKGRLIARYEFKELEIEKAQALSDKLNFNTVIQKPMSLTEIYNQDEKQFEQIKKYYPIGFKPAS